jgi:formate hydrogenlyase subunit 6/NADH:ubiquinone oxidoreductase subunit I
MLACCALQVAALQIDVEAAAAAVEAQLDQQEWNMQEIERIQEEQVKCLVCTWCITVCPAICLNIRAFMYGTLSPEGKINLCLEPAVCALS